MTVHLRKLAVGVADLEDFRGKIAKRVRALREQGQPEVLRHLTRHPPARGRELLDGGSLYWIVSGLMLVRSPILGIEDVADGHGKRCALVMDPNLIRTVPRPHRPFQGWRYLEPTDAPPDLQGASEPALPFEMERELRTLGLL